LDSAQALKDDNRLLAAQFADALFALQTNVSLTLAEIGNMQEFIEFNLERTTNNMMSLLEQQKDLEASKPEEQITMIKVLEALFSAQLQMGANLLPMSIFNFIN
ncbi:MAG: flagellar hook protein, partial [Oscillospiraceae bacterium]|nr:flagellar hook protein [Oscillospiraceae bacterium]